jgi:hypothetical protein
VVAHGHPPVKQIKKDKSQMNIEQVVWGKIYKKTVPSLDIQTEKKN